MNKKSEEVKLFKGESFLSRVGDINPIYETFLKEHIPLVILT